MVCVKAGARRDKPSRPRYDDDMWDPSQVLDYWRANPPRSIADKRACAVSLLMLAIYCRPSDLARFSIAHCSIAGNQLRYRIRGPKEAKDESFLAPVQFLDFMPEESEEASYCCAARALCAYWDSISHREKDESSGRGIIWSLAPKTAIGPLFPVGPECLSKVMHDVMRRAGVDPKFTGGSARSAGSSHALISGLDFTSVLSRGRWSSHWVFQKFYKRCRLQHADSRSALAPPRLGRAQQENATLVARDATTPLPTAD